MINTLINTLTNNNILNASTVICRNVHILGYKDKKNPNIVAVTFGNSTTN